MDNEQAASTEIETTATANSGDVSTENTTVDTTPTETYDWVPAKFIKEGKPDFQGMAKSYQSLESKFSTKGSFAPDDISGYVYEPKVLALNPERTTEFQTQALEAGLSDKQYQFVMGKYESMMMEFSPSYEKAETQLKADWGKQYDTNIELARKAFQHLAPSDVSEEDIGNNPAVLKMLARLGAELGEDTAPVKGVAAGGVTREEVEGMMNDPRYFKDLAFNTKVTEMFKKLK